jgi:transporter family-2 protein
VIDELTGHSALPFLKCREFGADVAIARGKGKRIDLGSTEMLELLIYALLTLAAGACVVTQQALNANLRTALDSAAWAGVVSYASGLACMIALALAVRDPFPSMSVIGRVPALAWTGGVFGAIFIIAGIVLIPHLGAATFIALLVTGQMVTAMAFDHFGLLGLAQRSADLPRIIGAALLIAGVILVRR